MRNVDMDAAARASFLKITPRKWRLIRLFEDFLKTMLPLLPSPRTLNDPESPPQSVLVVEYWNLGDLAILVPFLENLRKALPTARVTLLVNSGLAKLLDGQGLVDEFIPIRVPWAQHFSRWKKYNLFSGLWTSFARTLLAVRKRQFDWAFSGRMDVRDNFLLWLSGATRRIGYGFAGGAFLLTDSVLPELSFPHRTNIWLHLLEGLGHTVDCSLGSLHLTEVEANSANEFLRERGVPEDALLIGVHSGARIATRRWGDDRFAEVTRKLLETTNAHILWFSESPHPEEYPHVECCHLVNVEFRRFLALLARCKLLVCNDSGPMHIANLLGVPVVAVFGPQRPEWFGPRGAQDRVVIRPEFWCRPCFDYCMFDEPYCLRSIPPKSVTDSALEAITVIRGTTGGSKKLVEITCGSMSNRQGNIGWSSNDSSEISSSE